MAPVARATEWSGLAGRGRLASARRTVVMEASLLYTNRFSPCSKVAERKRRTPLGRGAGWGGGGKESSQSSSDAMVGRDGRGGLQLPSPYGGAHHNGRADQDEVLDDVLTLEGWRIGERPKGLIGEEEKRRQGPGHLREQEEEGSPEVAAGQQADPDQRLPRGQEGQAQRGRHLPEREPLDGPGREFGRGAPGRHELDDAEPEKDDAQGDAGERDPVPSHPRGDPNVDGVERGRQGHGRSRGVWEACHPTPAHYLRGGGGVSELYRLTSGPASPAAPQGRARAASCVSGVTPAGARMGDSSAVSWRHSRRLLQCAEFIQTPRCHPRFGHPGD